MKILNSLLALLPFNGDKTKLGVIATVATLAQAILIDPQAHLLVQTAIAAGTLAVGLFHKYVKASVK